MRSVRSSRSDRARRIVAALARTYAEAECALVHSNALGLLVATILSAQCTDVRVNLVTGGLFKKYRTFDDYVHADRKAFEQDIHSTGIYRNKAKNILAAAKMLKEKFGGKIPRTMEELLELPGVDRKTGNIVLGNAYGIVEGIAVDTHVKRLARVLGLSREENPEKIEQELMQIFPKKEWFTLTYRLIDYGRKYCTARPHDHAKCPLTAIAGQ